MRIILERNVPIKVYSVNMSLFIEEKKPEILPLLQAVKEANEKKEDPVDYLANTLFQEFPRKFSENIISELFFLNLIDKDKILTDRGKESLKNKHIMVLNEGAFEINVVDDPLIEQVILNLKELDADLNKELNKIKSNKREKKSRFVEIPDWIREKEGCRITTLENEKRSIEIYEIKRLGQLNKDYNKSLKLKLTYENAKWNLKVKYNNRDYSIDLPGNFDGNTLINEIFIKLSPSANLDELKIPQDPDELMDKEIKSFKKNFTLNKFESEKFGIFDSVKLLNIIIYPENLKSANIWAKKLFFLKLSSYLTERQYQQEWLKMIETSEELKSFELQLPPLEDILQFSTFASRKYWFLQAPKDLHLEDVMLND